MELTPLEPTPQRTGRRWTVVVNAILFLLAFTTVTRLVSPGFTEDRVLQAKRDHLDQHLDGYDAIFLGSSRVYRAFSPPQMNAHLEPEQRLSIFNYAVGSMRPHELNGVLDDLLRRRPKRLKLVFIELMDWNPTILEGMQDHDRTVRWHSLSETWRALQTIGKSDQEVADKFEAANVNVVAMLKHYTNYGEGVRWFVGRNRVRAARLEAVMAYADGFAAFDQETASFYAERRREFLERDLDIFREQILRIDEINHESAELTHFNVSSIEAQQQELERAGIEVVYVIPNLRWGTPDLNQLGTDGIVKQLWTFNHPSRFPELYIEEHYFDRGHLNRRGSEEFSRVLAERYVRWKSNADGNAN